ncbi:MAG: hypothetical protein PHZ00_02585 [Candidatus Peribacteraceae bacterium]|nr:hypothetical protein [Candidatus Peribacteraceae bacterium]
MKPFLVYWFWPNPGGWQYTDTTVQVILGACVLMLLASFVLAFWRSRLSNPMTRILSKSWPSAAFWFGITGVAFVVSREATIQFLSMRVLWLVWLVILALFAFIQFLSFRRRHYTVVANKRVVDEREKYLPRKK